jgi:hypothetical protein
MNFLPPFDWFKGRTEAKNGSGFPKLPDGAETVSYVVVEKK